MWVRKNIDSDYVFSSRPYRLCRVFSHEMLRGLCRVSAESFSYGRQGVVVTNGWSWPARYWMVRCSKSRDGKSALPHDSISVTLLARLQWISKPQKFWQENWQVLEISVSALSDFEFPEYPVVFWQVVQMTQILGDSRNSDSSLTWSWYDHPMVTRCFERHWQMIWQFALKKVKYRQMSWNYETLVFEL